MVKLKKRTLWSSKNSISHKPNKKKNNQQYASHSPRGGERHVYFEYSTPNKTTKKIKLGHTHDLTPNKFQMSSYSVLTNFNQQFSESKRLPIDLRIQRSFRGKGSRVKNRPPLHTTSTSSTNKLHDTSTKLFK